MDTLRRYRWRWGGNDEDRVQVRATVQEGGQAYTNVAVHLKGAAGSFRPVDQKPGLTLNFSKFAEGQQFHGLRKLSLNNSVQDPTYVSDKLSRELFAAAGVPAPRADHARVELNGRDLGLYVVSEGWDKVFLKRHFKNTRGNLYDGGFAKEITKHMAVNSGERPDDQSDLQALAAAAKERNLTNRLARLERVLDLDRFLSFMAMDVMLWNWDSYTINRNNYRVYHDVDTDRIVFFPHGMDQMFWRPSAPIMPGMKGLVAGQVIQIPECRRRYLERFSELRTNVFKLEAITNRMGELLGRIRPAISEMGAGRVSEHERGVSVLYQRIAQRSRSIDDQLIGVRNMLRFDEAGTAQLAGWKSKTYSGRPAFAQTGEKLQITTKNEIGSGSFWTTVWLERGQYRMEGKLKVRAVKPAPGAPGGGAGFRVFRRRKLSIGTDWDWFPYHESQELQQRGEIPPIGEATPRLAGNSEWVDRRYEFELRQPVADLEIHCELRDAKGEVSFDPASLKLIRKQR